MLIWPLGVLLFVYITFFLQQLTNFFTNIFREFHPKNIFKHMETVMCLVLEESDDDSLSLELLAVILAILKRDNEVSGYLMYTNSYKNICKI